MKTGFVICSRLDSSRINNKPLIDIHGKPLLIRLIERLSLTLSFPIVVAVPNEDAYQYSKLLRGIEGNVSLYFGVRSPLHRTLAAAKQFGFDHIIRVTHDKILVDVDSIEDSLGIIARNGHDYVYSSHLNDGTGFEIFTTRVLEDACKFSGEKEVEHLSYALKSVCKKPLDFEPHADHYNIRSDIRLLIDYQEDVDFIRTLYSYSDDDGYLNLTNAISTINKNPWLKKINKQPELTVYTCAYNEREYIPWCIQSVLSQTVFPNIEYIIIDDASTDDTYKTLVNSRHFSNKNIKILRNQENIGLSSSSNIALNLARGKYILRLDADDALIFPYTLEKMLAKIKQENLDALYPSFADDRTKKFRTGETDHHVGGCLFLTKAIRNIQFTEGLRGWEGLDLFERAKDQIKIGYYDELAFFYRDKPNSLSKADPEYREKIRRSIYGMDDCNGVPI